MHFSRVTSQGPPAGLRGSGRVWSPGRCSWQLGSLCSRGKHCVVSQASGLWGPCCSWGSAGRGAGQQSLCLRLGGGGCPRSPPSTGPPGAGRTRPVTTPTSRPGRILRGQEIFTGPSPSTVSPSFSSPVPSPLPSRSCFPRGTACCRAQLWPPPAPRPAQQGDPVTAGSRTQARPQLPCRLASEHRSALRMVTRPVTRQHAQRAGGRGGLAGCLLSSTAPCGLRTALCPPPPSLPFLAGAGVGFCYFILRCEAPAHSAHSLEAGTPGPQAPSPLYPTLSPGMGPLGGRALSLHPTPLGSWGHGLESQALARGSAVSAGAAWRRGAGQQQPGPLLVTGHRGEPPVTRGPAR